MSRHTEPASVQLLLCRTSTERPWFQHREGFEGAIEAGFLLVMLGSAVCLHLDWYISGEQEGEGTEANSPFHLQQCCCKLMLCGTISWERVRYALWTMRKKLLISSLVIGHAVSFLAWGLHCEYIGHHLIKTRERRIMRWQLNEKGFKLDLYKLDKKNKWWLGQKSLRRQDSCKHLCKTFRSLGFKGRQLEDTMSLHTNPDPQTF